MSKVTYKEFPDIEIPESLRLEDWQDNSWHNDVCPHSDYPLGDGSGIVVWVDRDDPNEREYASAPKFMVVWQPDLEDWSKDQDKCEVLYEGESEFAMMCAVTAFRLNRFLKRVNEL